MRSDRQAALGCHPAADERGGQGGAEGQDDDDWEMAVAGNRPFPEHEVHEKEQGEEADGEPTDRHPENGLGGASVLARLAVIHHANPKTCTVNGRRGIARFTRSGVPGRNPLPPPRAGRDVTDSTVHDAQNCSRWQTNEPRASGAIVLTPFLRHPLPPRHSRPRRLASAHRGVTISGRATGMAWVRPFGDMVRRCRWCSRFMSLGT